MNNTIALIVALTFYTGCTNTDCVEEPVDAREFVVYSVDDGLPFVHRYGDPAQVEFNSFAVSVMSDYDEPLRVQLDCYDTDSGKALYRALTPFFDSSHDLRPAEEIDAFFHPNVDCDVVGTTEDETVEYYASFVLRTAATPR